MNLKSKRNYSNLNYFGENLFIRILNAYRVYVYFLFVFLALQPIVAVFSTAR